MKIIYVAGYGRSGSTILSIMLGSHAEIAAIGEARFLLEDWGSPIRSCSCGAAYTECAFWKDLLSLGTLELNGDLLRLTRKIEGFGYLPRLLLGLVSEAECHAYKSHQTAFFTYVKSRARSSLIVDSSKSARGAIGRFMALQRLAEQDVYVLHLVRNGLETLNSLLLTGSNWDVEGYRQEGRWPLFRAVLGWTSVNATVSALGRLMGRGRYTLVRYEDLVQDPADTLRRLGQFCGFDPEGIVGRIVRDEAFAVEHVVGGNRVRLQQRVRLWRRGDAPPQASGLKPRQKLVFWLLGGWLNRLYGY
jgi:hypothetical protein